MPGGQKERFTRGGQKGRVDVGIPDRLIVSSKGEEWYELVHLLYEHAIDTGARSRSHSREGANDGLGLRRETLRAFGERSGRKVLFCVLVHAGHRRKPAKIPMGYTILNGACHSPRPLIVCCGHLLLCVLTRYCQYILGLFFAHMNINHRR